MVLQRRCIRAREDLKAGTTLTEENIEALRPAPAEAVMPYDLDKVLGRKLKVDKAKGEHFILHDVG